MQIASYRGPLALAWQSSHTSASSQGQCRRREFEPALVDSPQRGETGGDAQIDDASQTADVHADVSQILAALDWRAKVVHALACAPEATWGRVSSSLLFHLLDRRDMPQNPAVQCGVNLLKQWLAEARGTRLQGAQAEPIELIYDGQRFGISRHGRHSWAKKSMPRQGLWHALTACVDARDMSDVDVGDPSMWRSLMSRLVLSDPALAVAAWQAQLVGDAPEFSGQPPSPLRDIARRCGKLFVAGTALGVAAGFGSGALLSGPATQPDDGILPGSADTDHATADDSSAFLYGIFTAYAPLAAAVAAGALELAATVCTYAALPGAERSTAFQRAQYLSAFPRLLPSLSASELRALVLRLGPQFAQLDVRDVASAVQRCLDANVRNQPIGKIIAGLDVDALYREAREREQRGFRFKRSGAAEALEVAIQLAYAAKILTPWEDSILEARALRRSERWAQWREAQDALAQASAPRRLAATAFEPPPPRQASPVNRTFMMNTDDLPLPDLLTPERRDMLRGIVEQRVVVGSAAMSAMSLNPVEFMAPVAATSTAPDPNEQAGLLAVTAQAASTSLAVAASGKGKYVAGGTFIGVIIGLGLSSFQRFFWPETETETLEADELRALPLINRPMHHAKAAPVTEAPSPNKTSNVTPTGESPTLAQMLQIIEATEIGRLRNVSIDGYAGRAQAHLCRQMEAVLGRLPGPAFTQGQRGTHDAETSPGKPTMPWGGEVEVTFRFWGRSPEPSRFAMGWGKTVSQTFTLFDVALGHHFLREFKTPSGVSEIVSLKAVDPSHEAMLTRIDDDVFRDALNTHLADELERQRNNPLLIDDYEMYVRRVYMGVLVNATTDAWERQAPPGSRVSSVNHPWHPARAGQGQRRKFRAGYGAVRLLAYEGAVVPDLVCVTQPAGSAVLLISIAHAMAFHWSPEAESTDAFQRFIECHLSKTQRQHLERYARWSPLKFRIDPVVLTNRPCQASRADISGSPPRQSPSNAARASYSHVSLDPSFSFVSCPSPERELWFAKVARADSDRELMIINNARRATFQVSSLRQKVLDSLKFTGPATATAFGDTDRAGTLVTLACELDPYGANYATLAARAQRADVDELRRIQREMSVSASMSSLFRNPHLQPIDAVTDWTLENLDNMRDISRSIDTFMAGWPEISRRRGKFADDMVARSTDANGAGTPVTQPVWVELSAIKSRHDLRTGGAVTQGLTAEDNRIEVFLGSAAAQVLYLDQLSRIPRGYCIALALTDNTIGFAGVTNGDRAVFGAFGNAHETPSAAYTIDRIDIARFTFLANGQCRYDDRQGTLYVESLTDRLPVWSDNAKKAAQRLQSLRGSTTSTSTSTAPPSVSHVSSNATVSGSFKPQPNAEHLASRPRTKRAHDHWDALVDGWYVQKGRLGVRAGFDSRSSSATTVPPPRVGALLGRNVHVPRLSSQEIVARWNAPPVKAAFTQFVERVMQGLVLWHLPQMSADHGALMLAALKNTTQFRMVTVGDERLPCVVGLGDVRCRMLLSLTSGEAVPLAAEDETTALSAFLSPHTNVTGDTLRVTFGQSLDEGNAAPIIDDLRDRVRDAAARNQTLGAGVVDLVRRVAAMMPSKDAQSLRATIGDADTDDVRLSQEAIYLNEVVDGPQTSPGLGWAYDIGTAIREFSGDIFRRSPTGESLSAATTFAQAFVERIRQCRVQQRVSGDVASLIEWGINGSDFATAMLAAGVELEDGRFGAAIASLRDQVPGRPGLCLRQQVAPQLIVLRGREAPASVPRGYRILIRPASTGRNNSATYDDRTYNDMLSLGGGQIVEARSLETFGAARFRLSSIYPDSGDPRLRWAEARGVWRYRGVDVDLCIPSDTPGIYAEPAAPRLKAGQISATQCESALHSHPAVTALQPERVGARDLKIDDRLALMIEAVATTFDTYGVTDLRYRVTVAWSSPDQYRPKLSLAVTGKSPVLWVTQGRVGRVIADFFTRQTLRGALLAFSDGRVMSEADWQDQHTRHGANLCIKYIDFTSLNDALETAWGYTALPGALAGDFRPAGVMLRMPEWRKASE
ncbi:hypothetical protein [Pandoraea sp. ISTKB]|uniref:hypothetical protein n=1 Tax=Pandoraea sp. ISTKB TaxID=1586708 RepID=UPI0008478ED0|nr:hypothetical protein [Pandoraea sp. ISTKB]ODP34663.1 hypothetical protein A9762_13675 [Pandoraea sp. ISTKB]